MMDIGKELQAAFDDGYAARDKEIVRCGECEYHGEPHRTDMGVDVVWCNFYNTHKLKDGYCNCGERKDGD